MTAKAKRTAKIPKAAAAPQCSVYFYPSRDTSSLANLAPASFATRKAALVAAKAWLKTAKHNSHDPLREPTVEIITDGVVTDRMRKERQRGKIIVQRVTSPFGLTGRVKPPKLRP